MAAIVSCGRQDVVLTYYTTDIVVLYQNIYKIRKGVIV